MIKQQQALLETEGVDMQFTDAAIREISRVAEEVYMHCFDIRAFSKHKFHLYLGTSCVCI